MDGPKKPSAPAATGKKKVIRRLVKNAKTGEIIKTEIVRIDSSGEMTVTSYPAGTEVPSLSSLQSSGVKRVSRKSSIDGKPHPMPQPAIAPSKATQPAQPKDPSPSQKPTPAVEAPADKVTNMDVGPSVPVNVPGLEDLLERERELRKRAPDNDEKAKSKGGEESLETALISLMKKKRQRDPKARRRGLVASTLPRKCSDEEPEQDTDYRGISKGKKEAEEDDESEKRRKEKHRRRKEKKHKERSQVNDDIEEYQGETGPLDLPEIEPRKRPQPVVPVPEVPEEPDHQVANEHEDEEALSKDLQKSSIQDDHDGEPQLTAEKESDSDSEEEKKRKKKKHKHKKKKKKVKKQKKQQSESEKEDKEELSDGIRKSRSPSRTRSLSSVSLSSISSAFSDSFDFAGMNFDPSQEGGGGFDMALMEYQQVREQVFSGPFRGRGYDPFFRGRGSFRGFPANRGFGMFPPWRAPAPMFHFFQADPNFVPPGFPGGPGAEQDKGRGRGMPANQGPWRGRGLKGRGIPPGFHRNYTEDDKGEALYFQSDSSGSSSSGKRKKKKRHRRRSYSSSSYSSGSSHSRSRRRYRRRRRSSSYSSGSYSRSSYSRSRSDSRSRSRSSRSRSSYSRGSGSYTHSRSRSRSSRFKSRSQSRGSPTHWGLDDGRASPSYHAYDEDGFKPPVRDKDSDDEDVPWWAEFDKTYEVEKKKLEEERSKLEEAERAVMNGGKTKFKETLPSVISTDEIDVIQCVMSLVEKARAQQDETMEAARDCINHIINKISVKPVQSTQLNEETESIEKIAQDCVESMLDQVCPDDPMSAARICLNEIIDTVVEQEEEDKANEIASEMEKTITENKDSRLFQCYLKAQKLTEQMKAEGRPSKEGNEKSANQEDVAAGDNRRKDKKSQRSRHQRRSRSRSRERGRRRRRHSSSSSASSRSRGTPVPLVSKESLQQAQALLTLQQQQLQVAGLLGTGMPNLAGLTQAAALAAGLTPALLAQTGLKPSDLPNLIGDKPTEKENAKVAPKKDKESSKRDDLTRKLMQRMRDKKLKQEEILPAFQTRKDKPAEGTDKIFTGGGLKSRKIEISSSFGKLWTKVEGSPKLDDGTRDFGEANTGEDFLNNERTGNQEQENKVTSWSAQQAKLKEEAKREMREQIERAERAKKEKMKDEILEQERQKEIMRIREEVRSQIRKEIQDEIEKQRKSVLEDPNVREKLIQLEALRNQSGMLSANNAGGNLPVSSMPTAAANSSPASMSMANPVKDHRWYQQQMKNKQDMQKWMESHGYFASDIDERTLKRLQMTYMQNWTPGQRQAYMQWYWQGNHFHEPGHFRPQFGMAGQRQSAIPQNHRGANVPSSRAMEVRKPGPGTLGHPIPVSRLSEQHGIVPMSGRPMSFPHRNPYSGDNMTHPRNSLPPGVTAYNDRQFHDKPNSSQYRDMDGQPFAYDRFTARDPGATNAMRHSHPGGQQPVHAANAAPSEATFHHLRPGDSNVQMNHEQVQAMNHPETAHEGSNHPIHQYPPPCLEDEEGPENKMLKSNEVSDQPPPPGELEGVITERPIEAFPPPGNLLILNEDEGASKSKKKKRKKKHKKKKYSSSDEEEELNDPEAEKAAILAKLQSLPLDVEDGEIASDADNGGAKAVKKKRKAKKEKKKHKKRGSDSDDGERLLTPHPSNIPLVGGPHVIETYHPAPVVMPPEMNVPPFRGPVDHYANLELPSDLRMLPPHRDHGGAGEPHPVLLYPRLQKPPMGPGGDHSHAHRKRSPSPLPLVIPNDPMEYELWQRKMQARYQKDVGHGIDNPMGGRGSNRQFLAHIDRLGERPNDRDPIDGLDDDVVAMMRMMEDEQRRRDQTLHVRGRPMREDRKRRSALPHRGRRKQRRMMPRKSYHDWDKPEDDGQIYCRSGSESSGWGSDTNLNFDKMLAKKRKEAEKDRARLPQHMSPGQEQASGRVGWDRRELALSEDMMIPPAEKPQGIPVIGGGPRPIPTNVSMSRGPRRDIMGPHDFPTHDILKLPPSMAPMGYPQDSHFDQRREQAFIPPPVPVVSHPIPRLGSQGVPSRAPPPPIMINPNSQRIHPLNYGKQRFNM